MQRHHVRIFPLPINNRIGERSGFERDSAAIDLHRRVLAPPRDAQVERELNRLRRAQLQTDRLSKRIIGFLRDRDHSAIAHFRAHLRRRIQ